MPSVILAGYRRSYERMLREALDQHRATHPRWTWTLFPGNSKNLANLGADQIDELLDLSASLNGAPILGVSEHSQRNEVARRIVPHFRFRWIDANLVNQVARKEYAGLLNALDGAMNEESYWEANIRPTKFSSPLMLPEQFAAARSLDQIWRLARSFNNMDHLETACSLIERFSTEHRRRVDGTDATPWLDRRGWIWTDGGAPHGIPDFPEGWKLSYRIPDGRHFDVKPGNSSSTYTDAYGKGHSLPKKKDYWNITVHGFVRGAARS
jgi:hypothetical protein